MPNTITLETIEATYSITVEEVIAQFDLSKWGHIPTGVELDTHKSNYGQATKDGKVLINPAFIGTTAINKLKETMVHELTHLLVGLNRHHNKVFKRVENALRKGLVVSEEERNQVKLNNGYKLRLIAYGQSHTYDCGGVFRRTKKYTEYSSNQHSSMAIKGDRIERFEYVVFDSLLPEGTVTSL